MLILEVIRLDVLPPFVAFGIQGHGISYTGEDDNKRRLVLIREKWTERLNTSVQNAPLAFQSWNSWEERATRAWRALLLL